MQGLTFFSGVTILVFAEAHLRSGRQRPIRSRVKSTAGKLFSVETDCFNRMILGLRQKRFLERTLQKN